MTPALISHAQKDDSMIDVKTVFAVAVGAALGGVLRLVLSVAIANKIGGAPFGFYATLFINVSGSFLIGIVLETVHVRATLNPLWRYFLATGVLGGYTTFSSFSYEAVTLFANGLAGTALVYIAASVILAIFGTVGGISLVRAFVH